MGPSNDIHVSNRVKSPTSPQGGGVSRNNDRRITVIMHYEPVYYIRQLEAQLHVCACKYELNTYRKICMNMYMEKLWTPHLSKYSISGDKGTKPHNRIHPYE